MHLWRPGYSYSPCDFSVTPSPNWTFGFGFSLGFGLGGLDIGLGLDNLGAISNNFQTIHTKDTVTL